jgi:hypothetical protein
MHLLRHIYRRNRFALLGRSSAKVLGPVGTLRGMLGRYGPVVGTFQVLEGNLFVAYYCPPDGGRIRIGSSDFAVADVIDASLHDVGGQSTIEVTLRDGRKVAATYLRPAEPFSLDDWYAGRTGWDMPARIADALRDAETREEWARNEFLRVSGASN